jgi:hypothetical protein
MLMQVLFKFVELKKDFSASLGSSKKTGIGVNYNIVVYIGTSIFYRYQSVLIKTKQIYPFIILDISVLTLSVPV